MASTEEYHISVHRSFSRSVAVLSVAILSVVLIVTASAQINGAPASVTSPGFGGRAINGAPASVTSLGPQGFSPGPRAILAAPNGHRDGLNRNGSSRTHHHHYVPYVPPYAYAVPVPYAVDIGQAEDEPDPSSEDEYQGGPTIFDRRGYGAASYVPPVKDVPKPHAAAAADPAPDGDPDPPQPTTLVFKDGHKLDVNNYAIVGQTLFDLTPGHARRIALADLDLEATRQQNEDRGVNFQIPVPQAN